LIGVVFGLGRGFDLFGVSCIECYSSCKVLEVGKTWIQLMVGWLGYL
jgi:hypothetical protein